MAETRTIDIDIKVNANETEKDFKKVADKVGELKEKASDSEEEIKKMSTASKGLGTALKAAGIGLVIAAFAKFKEVLNENQKVADFFSTTFEVLSIAFNDFFNFILDNIGGVVDSFKSIFEDPIQSIKNLGNAIVDNIVERFNSAIESIGFLGDAIVKVFSGDFKGAAESAKNAGKELIDVVTGVDNTFDKTVETVNNVIEATTNYVNETVKAAKATVELNKQAEIAAVRQQGIVEQFDRQAEKLRQVRDEERNTIEERIAANDKLKETLDEQEKAMLKQVDLQIAAAAVEFNKNKNHQNTIALLEAQQERTAVLAQIEGLRSEQLAQDLALDREKIELTNTKLESEATLSIERKRINAEQIKDDITRLQRQQKIDAEEEILQTERLQRVIDQAKEGTQAKVDAQIALDEFEVEILQKKLEREKEFADKKKELYDKELEFIKDSQEQVFNVINQFAQLRIDKFAALNQAVLDNEELTDKQKDKMLKENNKKAKKAFEVQKAASIASALITTYQSAISAYQSQFVPLADVSSPVRGGIAAGLAVATGLANVANIASQKFEGASISKSESPSGEISGGAPQFNVVGDSGVNQLATLQQQPTQAYVVSGEVTTAQALDRNRVQNATL